jgi:NitT/TauT family transport system substrate-binding protein
MRAASWIVLLAALVAGRTALADDRLRVGTPEPTAFVFAAVDVGIDTGIFAKYGLTIERIDFAGGAKLHQAMAAGALDIIVGTGSDLLFVVRGAPERGVAAYANDLNSLSIVARADDVVKTLADVRGKTVGTTTTGSFTSWIGKQIATSQGWGPDGIKLAYLGAQSGLVAGLMAKNVDAIVGTSAGGLLLEAEGRGRVIVRAGDMITEFIADIIYASDPLMTEHPDQLRRYLRAWFDIMRFMKENKAETIRLTQKDTHLPDKIAAQIYDTEIPTFFTDGHFNRKNLAAVKQSLIDVGVVETMPPDDALITEKFLP